MKNLITITLGIFLAVNVSAQQLSMYSQYYWNDYVINPAFTGIKNTPRVQFGYRNQWSGFQGSPKTYTVGGHVGLNKLNMGLGGMIFSDDQGGAIRQNGVMLNYSYQLKLNKNSGLSFGVAGILNQYGFNGSQIQNINPDATLQANVTQLTPDMNFGVVYQLNNQLFIGLAANQLVQSRLSKFNTGGVNLSENQLIRHYNLSASYVKEINPKIDIEPYVLLRSTFIKAPQWELGGKVNYNKLVFGGLSYRSNESVIGLVGVNYQNFMFAYSYDFTLSAIRNYSGGSHEILLAYQFNKKSKSPKVVIEQPKQPKDSDGDGVIDSEDDCPDKAGTREGRGCPDSDGDGVSDNEDLCPNVKGLKEYKGCPDTDGDGVFDDLDECPKVVGPKENKGCPWPDSDNDGLSDNKDDCPTISGPVENRGCPYGDTDGDGVNDNEDDCPKTPGPISNKGCPIIEKKDQDVIDMAVKNLEFETSKDIIEESSKSSLNTLADKLKQKGEWNLLLSGHTDNVGDDDANMILSKNRAEAVKNYFISKGIAENRIKVNYFGETKPIADNSTPEGRQKNRRVEFVIVFE
jgi:type IX secretion system PorP/SprF family membrane protein